MSNTSPGDDQQPAAVRPPLSLYIHVPWCVRKCPYCDFNSHAFTGTIPESAYLQALLEDLDQDLAFATDRPIETVFIGGGTPSLMSGDFYDRLFRELRARLAFATNAEITLEANPGTLEAGRFDAFRAAGINRLSIGVQSFNPDHLKTLGRIHDADAAHRAIRAARRAGFDNFNIDLMHGLPGQTPGQALEDIQTALDYKPPHLSWYQLTLEPNTEFYSRPPELPDDDHLWDIYRRGSDYLHQHGYEDYEVSAWSLQGRASRHNLNYWTFGDYLALGAGAHGKISLVDGGIRRYWKTRQPDAYLNRIGSRTAGSDAIAVDDLPLEFLMNALRLKEGVDESLFSERTGLPLTTVGVKLEQLRNEKLLVSDRLQATDLGQRYLNSLLERFL
ncbi:oxygen-independent coproporphyrinogen-3 oxidase [Marinobacter sp. DSM 26671]|uniref:Heme chaperone HemW n=2 Tax=Marinobacter TaxID=2742 RepID=A0A3D8GZS4_9GAMM|nr:MULTISPECIES: radical SAM family heme chaperone HemW [Marinobacter]MBI46523.1 radical SAM protein [Marinobacter sp.]MCP4064217.1 radical SAM family heme chaperone HemW [Gammaproteobacteria bacterium]MEC7729394.1 radical SAM family heme chaperone HemW [Pseudomonadota bacterium]HAP52496.1 radical SAM protein [Marinobacter adhaerens]AKV96921.1 oxidase [Marinobacter sp. CP1]